MTAPLELVYYPDPFLKQCCREITPEEIASGIADGHRLDELADRMKEIMFANNGLGLAAPQVRVGLRMFLLNWGDGRWVTLLNPALLTHGDVAKFGKEGCLSMPGKFAMVNRFERICVKALLLSGLPIEFTTNDMVARVCQHEIDHLDGILISDRGLLISPAPEVANV